MLSSCTEVRYNTIGGAEGYRDSIVVGNNQIQFTYNGDIYGAAGGRTLHVFVPALEWANQQVEHSTMKSHLSLESANTYVHIERRGYFRVGSFWAAHPNYDDDSETYYYGMCEYEVIVDENISSSDRAFSLIATFYVVHSENHATVVTYDHNGSATISCLQEAPDSTLPATTTIYYYLGNTADQIPSLASMTPKGVEEVQVSNVYDESGDRTSGYSYIWFRTRNNYYAVSQIDVGTYQGQDWITVERTIANAQLYPTATNNCYVRFKISVAANTDVYQRTSSIPILYGNTAIALIEIQQDGAPSQSGGTVQENHDVYEYEVKYWNNSQYSPSIVDTNEGAAVDATSLLFKSNFANIYNTLEQKDGTLFLGNYQENKNVFNAFEVLKAWLAASNTNTLVTENLVRRVFVNDNASQYFSYIPDMTQSSQQKRIFKNKESYILGIVFVDKYGAWSPVYSLGVWNVDYVPHLINPSGTICYNKPVRYVGLPSSLTTLLYNAGVIAAIPVYAVKQANKVVCQGFLSPTVSSNLRHEEELLDAQYSWFYRDRIADNPNYDSSLDNLNTGSPADAEIQNLTSNPTLDSWKIVREICTLNTPEVEASELLQNSNLKGIGFSWAYIYTGTQYKNNALFKIKNKYIHSNFSTSSVEFQDGQGVPLASITDRRFVSGLLWNGFLDAGYSSDAARLTASNNSANYQWYYVYPWQRNIIGGEGETSTTEDKILFNSVYSNGLSSVSTSSIGLPTITDAQIYRDFDSFSLLKIGSKIYQGNTDYVSITNSNYPYKAWTLESETFPHTENSESNNNIYAGYDEDGNIIDPISIRYKTAPHIVLTFNQKLQYDDSTRAIFCAELTNEAVQLPTDTHSLQGYQWIKCGDLKRIIPNDTTQLFFEEGDYFFGRFESLRTYQYAEHDPNSVVEVVSGMLCSRVNLDSRCDRNRNTSSPLISPENFNLFNPVYNQANNYFTFNYIDTSNIIYNRKYNNSMQWSLKKEYSSDIDTWCNIQDINTMDFDGDKGKITSIERLGNELIVFQDAGISQVQYNEKTQLSTEQGLPVEISNSGKVTGKNYLYTHVGCQYKGAIASSPNGLYFVDNLNKSLYELTLDSKLTDLCTAYGMKSWGLANLDDKWWTYYDHSSQEVLFTNSVEALAFNDLYNRFSAFLGYGGIRWNFRAADSIIQILPPGSTLSLETETKEFTHFKNFEYTSSSGSRSLSRSLSTGVSSSVRAYNKDMTSTSQATVLPSNTFWKKNSIDETKFFGYNSPIEIQLQCNPEPTVDKSFSVVEYRMDCFGYSNNYLPGVTFNTFRAWNEYQDTEEVSLLYDAGNETGPVYNTQYSTKLRKKFRIWRLDIPRAWEINSASQKYKSQDRIRNPWCNIYFKMDTSRAYRIVLNDLAIQYFK